MSTQRLREISITLRLLDRELAAINTAAKQAHSEVGHGPWTGQKQLITDQYEAKKKPLKDQWNALRDEREAILLAMEKSPVSMKGLSHIIDNLVEVETAFTLDTWQDAWTKLTHLIDALEAEEIRIEALSQESKQRTPQ